MPAPAAEYVTRFVPTRAADIRMTDDARLTGFAIVFNSLSVDLGGFRERIAPAAVDRTLRTGQNVDALLDHRRETTTILGSTDSGLLQLKKESKGLRAVVAPPDTQAARDAITVIKAGLVKGMSFAFRVMPDGDEWDEEDGELIRTVRDMAFSEVSFVVNPAYEATSVSARTAELDRETLDAYRATIKRWPSRALRERHVRALGLR